MSTALFPLGQTVITAQARDVLNAADVPTALARHAAGDWGELCEEDWKTNEVAMTQGHRLLSVYRDSGGVRFWIITEADRSATTVLLPEDY